MQAWLVLRIWGSQTVFLYKVFRLRLPSLYYSNTPSPQIYPACLLVSERS